MKHTLIVIGWMSHKHAYLDVSREEAVKRYCAEEGENPSEDDIKVIELDDKFYVYDAWGDA